MGRAGAQLLPQARGGQSCSLPAGFKQGALVQRGPCSGPGCSTALAPAASWVPSRAAGRCLHRDTRLAGGVGGCWGAVLAAGRGMHWRGSSLLLALQSPCLPRVAQPNPPSASHGHHGAFQLGQGCTGQADAGPAALSPSSGMCRTGPSPSPCPPPALSQQDPHCCRGSSAEDARGVPALQPGLGVLSVLLTVQSGSGP